MMPGAQSDKKISIIADELARVVSKYLPEGCKFVLIVHSGRDQRLVCNSNASRSHVIDYLRTTLIHLRKLRGRLN